MRAFYLPRGGLVFRTPPRPPEHKVTPNTKIPRIFTLMVATIVGSMDFDLPSGKYVVAVSGGIDSVVLLHILLNRQPDKNERKPANTQKRQYIVAHYDHGIRGDSALDRRHVENLAREYRLPFVYERGDLGISASEATARHARYDFLHRVRQAGKADAIITAHHQDDYIETALLNMVRGTGSRGLHAMKSTDVIRRPLLHVAKRDIQAYAEEHGLSWREDPTNTNDNYLRNRIRRHAMPRLNKTSRNIILKRIAKAAEINREIDHIITGYLHRQPALPVIERMEFVMLPHVVSREVLAVWLRRRTKNVELSRRMLERLTAAIKTGRSGSLIDIAQGYYIRILPDSFELIDSKKKSKA